MPAKQATRPREAASLPAPSPLTPIWKEALWPVDWLALHASPVYYGLGVPLGDGSPVVLVPGFMGSDVYLFELYLWLGRIGYRPYMSGIGVNAECPSKLTTRLLKTMRQAKAETERPVRVVGHSLGGVIGRLACLQQPDLASQLVYLGSPIQKGVRAHPAVLAAASLLRFVRSFGAASEPDCLSESCHCDFARNLLRPLPSSIHHAAIYSHADGVVDWHDSLERERDLNHEVGGTHIGLVYNPRAYLQLAELLAQG